jgi:hypothetical protein
MRKREIAERIFSEEYNRARIRLSGEDVKAPSYLLTELGRKVNRLFVVGVLTKVDQIGEKDMVKATLHDPTGMHTIYSGVYQSDVTSFLQTLKTPILVGVVGKAHSFEPEPGRTLASIRPEKIKVVDNKVRNYWIYETYLITKRKFDYLMESLKMSPPTIGELLNLGCRRSEAENILETLEKYGKIDAEFYQSMLDDTITYLAEQLEQGSNSIENIENKDLENISLKEHQSMASMEENIREEEKEFDLKERREEMESSILKIIDSEDGIEWSDLIEKGERAGFDKFELEETISALIDKGIIYEPVLGKIRKVS